MGTLLAELQNGKQIKGQGVELNETCIYLCVEKGVSVFHSDIDSGLEGYPDHAFDVVILNQSLQEVKNVQSLLKESLRVGRRVIVGFPNFAYWKARFSLMFAGHAPVTPSLPYDWSDTPNVRFMSITDFNRLCKRTGFHILSRRYLGTNRIVRFLPNFFALNSIFVLTRL